MLHLCNSHRSTVATLIFMILENQLMTFYLRFVVLSEVVHMSTLEPSDQM